MAARLFHMQFIIMSNSVHTIFFLFLFSFFRRNECFPVVDILSVCVCVHMSRDLFGFDSLMKIKQCCQTNRLWPLSNPERVPPNVIVNHQQRRRRKVLLSFRCSHALGHGCYFIIPPSTAMVNLFHYDSVSVHVLVVFVCRSVCMCMLLRSGFITASACVSLRPEIKLGGLWAQIVRPNAARKLAVIHTRRLEGKMSHVQRLIIRNVARWEEIEHVWVLCSCIYTCECFHVLGVCVFVCARACVCVFVCDSVVANRFFKERLERREEGFSGIF